MRPASTRGGSFARSRTGSPRSRPGVIVAAAHNRTFADEWIARQFPHCVSVGFVNPARPTSLDIFDRMVDRPIDEHEADKQHALFTAITGNATPLGSPRITLDASDLDAGNGGVARARPAAGTLCVRLSGRHGDRPAQSMAAGAVCRNRRRDPATPWAADDRGRRSIGSAESRSRRRRRTASEASTCRSGLERPAAWA